MAAISRRILFTLVSGPVLAIAPLAAPALGHADDTCQDGRPVATDQCGVRCPDGTVVDEAAGQCRAQAAAKPRPSLEEQLRQLPSPSELPEFNASDIPPLARVDLPDVVLPGVGFGLGLVPDINIAPQLPGLGVPQLPAAPRLPAAPKLTTCGPELGFGFKPCI